MYMDKGYLYAEYLSTLLYRYVTKSSAPLQEGNAKIEIKLQFEPKPGIAPAQLTMSVNGASGFMLRNLISVTIIGIYSEYYGFLIMIS